MAIPDSEIISSYKKKPLQDPCLKFLKRKMNTKEFSPPMAKTYNLLKHILDQYDQEIAESNLDAVQEFVKVEDLVKMFDALDSAHANLKSKRKEQQ